MNWYVILMSRPKKAMRSVITPILKRHRIWYRYTGGAGDEEAHFSVEFENEAQAREVTHELNEAVKAKGWPLGVEMYET